MSDAEFLRQHDIPRVVDAFITDLLRARAANVFDFMIEWARERKAKGSGNRPWTAKPTFSSPDVAAKISPQSPATKPSTEAPLSKASISDPLKESAITVIPSTASAIEVKEGGGSSCGHRMADGADQPNQSLVPIEFIPSHYFPVNGLDACIEATGVFTADQLERLNKEIAMANLPARLDRLQQERQGFASLTIEDARVIFVYTYEAYDATEASVESLGFSDLKANLKELDTAFSEDAEEYFAALGEACDGTAFMALKPEECIQKFNDIPIVPTNQDITLTEAGPFYAALTSYFQSCLRKKAFSWKRSDRQLYAEMNRAMRLNDQKELLRFRDFIYHLTAALNKLPSTPLVVFRGINVFLDFNTYRKGVAYSWPAFSSTSASRDVAVDFMGKGDGGTLFIVLAKNGKEVQHFSKFLSESEWLLPPNTVFTVRSGLDQYQVSLMNGQQMMVLEETSWAAVHSTQASIRTKLVLGDGTKYEGSIVQHPHGKGRMEYVDGSTYEGDFVEGGRHGQGVYESRQNGEMLFRYEGEFADNRPEGQCTIRYSDGSVYTGMFGNGIRNGQGTFVGAYGNSYVGNFVNGKREGKGKYTFPNGDVYDGDWKDDLQHGEGELIFGEGTYRGNWRHGKFHGKGKLTYNADGEALVGLFKDGFEHGPFDVYDSSNQLAERRFYEKGPPFHYWGGRTETYHGYGTVNRDARGRKQGRGSFIWARSSMIAGSRYDGDWVDNLPHGQGTRYFCGKKFGRASYTMKGCWHRGALEGAGESRSDFGGVFVGNFRRGLPNGHGVFDFAAKGIRIEGNWVDGENYEGEVDSAGLFHGKGKSTTVSKQHSGEFVHGKRDGRGCEIIFEDGTTYEGMYKDGYRNGKGVAKYADGSVYEGEWKRETTHGVRSGRGKYVDGATGTIYEGEWKGNQKHGRGVEKNKNGGILRSGRWNRGVFIGD